jgi:hypothetical protein
VSYEKSTIRQKGLSSGVPLANVSITTRRHTSFVIKKEARRVAINVLVRREELLKNHGLKTYPLPNPGGIFI